MWMEAARVPVDTAPSPGAMQGSHILKGNKNLQQPKGMASRTSWELKAKSHLMGNNSNAPEGWDEGEKEEQEKKDTENGVYFSVAKWKFEIYFKIDLIILCKGIEMIFFSRKEIVLYRHIKM